MKNVLSAAMQKKRWRFLQRGRQTIHLTKTESPQSPQQKRRPNRLAETENPQQKRRPNRLIKAESPQRERQQILTFRQEITRQAMQLHREQAMTVILFFGSSLYLLPE